MDDEHCDDEGSSPPAVDDEQIVSWMRTLGGRLDTRPVSLAEQGPLILLAKQGDRRAHNRLLGAVFRYICQQAQRTSRCYYWLEPTDLITAGWTGVAHAIEKFDLNRYSHIRFLTYSGWWIRQAMTRYAQTSGLVRQPTHRRRASVRDAAREVDAMVWIDEGIDGGLKLPELIVADDREGWLAARRILAASAQLPDRRWRFAFETTAIGDLTLQEAGRYLRVTRSRLQQLRDRAALWIHERLVDPTPLPEIWVPSDLSTCLTEGCDQVNTRRMGGAALRCRDCFALFLEEARGMADEDLDLWLGEELDDECGDVDDDADWEDAFGLLAAATTR